MIQYLLLDAVKKSAEFQMNDHLEFIKTQKSLKANIETSHRCPLLCLQCTRSKLNFPKDSNKYKEIKSRINAGYDLPIEDARKLLDFFESGLMLCGQLSDPVYWKNFFEFLKLCKEYPDRTIQIHTAASQKDIEWYKKAFELTGKNIIWRFGIDGLKDTSFIYRSGQKSELLFDAMILAAEKGLNVEWQFIIFDYNVHQIEEAKSIANRYSINLQFVKSDRTGGGVKVPNEYKPKRNKEITNAI